MRIAVFSDIHGNPFACQAVLKAIKENGVFDTVVSAGDQCYGGSNPAECVDMLIEFNIQAIQGNTDTYIFNPEVLPPDKEHRQDWDSIQATANWAGKQMGQERIAWLRNLPFEQRFSPTDNPANALLVVHANPKNTHDIIAPPYEDQIDLKGEIVQPDDDSILQGLLADEPAKVVAFGHLHYSSLRHWREKILVNVAPCGITSHDGDNRARYSIFTWDKIEWKIERCYVEYAYEKYVEALLTSDIPYKEEKVKKFRSSF